MSEAVEGGEEEVVVLEFEEPGRGIDIDSEEVDSGL